MAVAAAAVTAHHHHSSSEDSNDSGSHGHGHAHSGSGADELGYKPVQTGDSWWADDTLVNSTSRDSGASLRKKVDVVESEGPSPNLHVISGDTLRPSSYPPAGPTLPSPTHQRSFSAAVPLLDAIDGGRGDTGVDEFGVSTGVVGGMAGVGTAARSGRLGTGLRRESMGDFPDVTQ